MRTIGQLLSFDDSGKQSSERLLLLRKLPEGQCTQLGRSCRSTKGD